MRPESQGLCGDCCRHSIIQVTISRLLDKSDCWRNLAEKSLLRYEMIEYESGIKFYNECGFLSLIDEKVSTNRLGKIGISLYS